LAHPLSVGNAYRRCLRGCDSLTYQFLTCDSGAEASVTQLDRENRPDV
jgi:hypothetical protein